VPWETADPAEVWAALVDFVRRPDWQADALCKEYPTVNFFPEVGESAKEAREVCSKCLCRAECLAYGIETRSVGIWGGKTFREREAMRRRPAA
jgi:WhiB family redox-sensing transcriptional regulator